MRWLLRSRRPSFSRTRRSASAIGPARSGASGTCCACSPAPSSTFATSRPRSAWRGLSVFPSCRLVRTGTSVPFGAYILSGVLPWSYCSQTAAPGSTAIVEGASLTDKVWFPRAILPASTVLANVPGLAVSMVLLIVALPILGVPLTARLLLLPAACLLLVAFTLALVEALSALHVYFRDVRFLVQAGLVMWFYVTPIAYPKSLLKGLATWVDLNPLTGVVTLFHMATVGGEDAWQRPVLIAVAVTVVLMVVAAEAQRRRDRLFVDLL
ncbi:MAG: hypothetical protein E6G57_04225 [Actinobacteria bacterium]|nr:MAG: hypothetical protein E6G57_04225 [Actinomycetota bacterium]